MVDRLEELEQKHGRGRVLDFTIGGVDIFFTIPSQGDHERFMAKTNENDPTVIPVAIREYVLSSNAEPDRRDEIANLFEQNPAAPNVIAGELKKAAEGGCRRREKKYSNATSTPKST
jgi:hypothetical protein